MAVTATLTETVSMTVTVTVTVTKTVTVIHLKLDKQRLTLTGKVKWMGTVGETGKLTVKEIQRKR